MQKLHRILIDLCKTHHNAAHLEFSKTGLTQGQPKVLDFLALNNGCIQKDIAEYCRIEPATVTSLLANMEKSNLVYRTQSIENRRIQNVFLTEKGVAAQKEVTRVFDKLNSLCFKDFTPDEIENAIMLLTRMKNNLEGMDGADAND